MGCRPPARNANFYRLCFLRTGFQGQCVWSLGPSGTILATFFLLFFPETSLYPCLCSLYFYPLLTQVFTWVGLGLHPWAGCNNNRTLPLTLSIHAPTATLPEEVCPLPPWLHILILCVSFHLSLCMLRFIHAFGWMICLTFEADLWQTFGARLMLRQPRWSSDHLDCLRSFTELLCSFNNE